MSWIDDLPGIKDILANGVALARRSKLNFIGFTVEYNQQTGAIDVTATGGGGSGTGDVTGPGASSNGVVALFSGTTGKLLKAGAYTIAALLNRSNHTGTQAISTIAGLQTALDAKENSEDLADIATSGKYEDLSDAPELAAVATDGTYSSLIDAISGMLGLTIDGPYTADHTVGIGKASMMDATDGNVVATLPSAADVATFLAAHPSSTPACAICALALGNNKVTVHDPVSGADADVTLLGESLVFLWGAGIAGGSWLSIFVSVPPSSYPTVVRSGSYADLLNKPALGTSSSKDASSTTSGGESDSGKVPVLNASGQIDASFLAPANRGDVTSSRKINTTAPLTGGGDLSADRELGISAATTSAPGSMSSQDKTDHDAIVKGFVGTFSITGAAYTLQAADLGKIGVYSGTSDCDVTVPAGLATGVVACGFRPTGSGMIGLVGASGVDIWPTTGFDAKSARTGALMVLAQDRGTNAWSVTGDLAEALPTGQQLYEDGAVATTTTVGDFTLMTIPSSIFAAMQTWNAGVNVIARVHQGTSSAENIYAAIDSVVAWNVLADGSIDSIMLSSLSGAATNQSGETYLQTPTGDGGEIQIVATHPSDYDGKTIKWSVRVSAHGLTHGFADDVVL